MTLEEDRLISVRPSLPLSRRWLVSSLTSHIFFGASTATGNVTYELPACHPNFAIPTPPEQGNHTPGVRISHFCSCLQQLVHY